MPVPVLVLMLVLVLVPLRSVPGGQPRRRPTRPAAAPDPAVVPAKPELLELCGSVSILFAIVCILKDIPHISTTPMLVTRRKCVHDVEQDSPGVDQIELNVPQVRSAAPALTRHRTTGCLLAPRSDSAPICRPSPASYTNTRALAARPSERVYEPIRIFRVCVAGTQPPSR